MESIDFEAIKPNLFYSQSPSTDFVPAHLQTGKVCSSFTRQELAFEYYDNLLWHQKQNAKLFSFESVNTGKRLFLVAEYGKFCSDYFNADARHVYEIIRERYPCRIYFDLEFPVAQNPSVDGDTLTQLWIELVIFKVYELFSVHVASHHVIVLDSCTPEKYSKHLIIQLFSNEMCLHSKSDWKELLMANNLEVGYLINLLLLDITAPYDYATTNTNESVPNEIVNNQVILEVQGHRRVPRSEYENFFVRNKDGTKRTCFVDLGVYTKNRAFRLFYSSKFGKTKKLGVSLSDVNKFQMKLNPSSNLLIIKKDRLTSSLVIPPDIFNSSMEYAEQASKKVKIEGIEVSNDTANDDSAIPTNEIYSDKYIVLPLLNPEGAKSGLIAKDRSNPSNQRFNASQPWKSNEVARSVSSRESSWFPLLDEFVVEHCASNGGIRGVLNSWSLTAISYKNEDPSGGEQTFTFYKLKYQVLRNRFCGNINRQHKSNGIMLEVDLIQKTVVQSCWDSDCKGYKSPPIYVPDELIPDVNTIQGLVLDYQINLAIKQKPQEWLDLL